MMILDIITTDSLAGLVSLLLSYDTNVKQEVTSQKMMVCPQCPRAGRAGHKASPVD